MSFFVFLRYCNCKLLVSLHTIQHKSYFIEFVLFQLKERFHIMVRLVQFGSVLYTKLKFYVNSLAT